MTIFATIIISIIALVVLLAIIGAMSQGLESPAEFLLFLVLVAIEVILFHILFLGGFSI